MCSTCKFLTIVGVLMGASLLSLCMCENEFAGEKNLSLTCAWNSLRPKYAVTYLAHSDVVVGTDGSESK